MKHKLILKKGIIILLLIIINNFTYGQNNTAEEKFRQLDYLLETPTEYRTGSGAPGHKYWQQKTDYNIRVVLDEKSKKINGEVEIKFHNKSPDNLDYIWLQLDQNISDAESDKIVATSNQITGKMTYSTYERMKLEKEFDGGFKISEIKDIENNSLNYDVIKTMMRINLNKQIKSGEVFTFKIKYNYNIPDRIKLGGRSGYEYFEEDDNIIFTIAQFYPRMVLYTDYGGWQHKQYLGRGEFTLAFGDYYVEITVPSDHIVSATGELQNPNEVLTSSQISNLEKAKKSNNPIMIVPFDEAVSKEKTKSTKNKTWKFKAINVRDFAFANSRKFIWDAMGVPMSNKIVMAMSFYPKEAFQLWEKVSTRAVAHTLRVYSKFTFDYPYPVAQSVNSKDIGMEYPMICFNWGRVEEDGTYSKVERNRTIEVIIHEVGHNYFPMIVNSNERQWSWMDEGLNSFLEYLAEQEWERNFPSRRGPAYTIANYMKMTKENQVPIMSNSESIIQFGNNAYGKPAAALNILRETVIGRKNFDFAFKTYAQRWMFKHPTPTDFFRTMEDASGIDLDWFWRGWFYGTDHVDVSIEDVSSYRVDTKNPDIEKPFNKKVFDEEDKFGISNVRNANELKKVLVESDTFAKDFYTTFDQFKVYPKDKENYKKFLEKTDSSYKLMLDDKTYAHQIKLVNIGGLVSPVILLIEYADGSNERLNIPAEIWRYNDKEIYKIVFSKKEIKSVTFDPNLETADVDIRNNNYPRKILETKFELYEKEIKKENEMQMYKN